MLLSRLIYLMKLRTNSAGKSASSPETIALYWKEYYDVVSRLIDERTWTWNLESADLTVEDSAAIMPYRASTFPVMVLDQTNESTARPIDGMTKFYANYVYRRGAFSSSYFKMFEMSDTVKTAEETGTVTGYNDTTFVITDSGAAYTIDALIGKTIKVNGEESFYQITDNTATQITLDRAYSAPGVISTGQNPTDLSYVVEPSGRARMIFPDFAGTLRVWYSLRFSPAVNSTDDCGWDSRLDTELPNMIAAQYIMNKTTDDGERTRAKILFEQSKKHVMDMYINEITPESANMPKFVHPDSPFGAGWTYSPEGILNSERFSTNRRRREGDPW